jgi:hypothetical protein
MKKLIALVVALGACSIQASESGSPSWFRRSVKYQDSAMESPKKETVPERCIRAIKPLKVSEYQQSIPVSESVQPTAQKPGIFQRLKSGVQKGVQQIGDLFHSPSWSFQQRTRAAESDERAAQATLHTNRAAVEDLSPGAPQLNKDVMRPSESSAETPWVSPGGLIYGKDKKFGTRREHVLQHTRPDPTKRKHSVFTVTGNELFDLIDFAWSKKGAALSNDSRAYIIHLEKVIGTQGEKAIKIIVKPGTAEIITAYPIKE